MEDEVGLALLVGLGSSCMKAQEEAGVMEIKVLKETKQPETYIGVGYHAYFAVQDKFTTSAIEKILAERWRELAPSFARVTHKWGWNMEFAARQIAIMKEAGTAVYLTTWDPEKIESPEGRDAYAEKVAGLLEDLVVKRGLDNIKWYCMSNELSLPPKWGAMYQELETFKDYHERICRAIRKRGLKVGLLATDASPTERWDSIRWAVEHMDEVTGAYGGHHYINDYRPDNRAFYDWFEGEVKGAAELAHAKGKPFVIGEFGPKQHQGERYGYSRWDGCAYFDTPMEPLSAVQTAEAVIAAVNGGADGVAYWTFEDFPDDYGADKGYANKWGTFRWDGKGFERRPVYYAMGLMSRFFRGPARVHEVSKVKNVRVLAIEEKDGSGFRVAVLNRRTETVRVRVSVEGMGAGWEGYLFNPAEAEGYVKTGALINEKNRVEVKGGEVTVPTQSLVVLVEKR